MQLPPGNESFILSVRETGNDVSGGQELVNVQLSALLRMFSSIVSSYDLRNRRQTLCKSVPPGKYTLLISQNGMTGLDCI